MKALPIPGLTPVPDTSASASEDFAAIAEKIPSVFMYLSAGYMDERGMPGPQSGGMVQRGRLSDRRSLSGSLRGWLAGRTSVNRADGFPFWNVHWNKRNCMYHKTGLNII